MSKISVIQLGIIWERLNGLIDEVGYICVKTSFSSVVRENWDFALTLLDPSGRQFVQSRRSVPSFIGTMPQTLQKMLEVHPKESLKPGDVLITNDGWYGTGHLNDITMIHPIFRKGRLIAFVGSIFHSVDIGGAPSPTARDNYEEGLCIPICKIVEEGNENPVVINFIEKNVRASDETLGDIRAQFSAYALTTQRLFKLMAEEGLEGLEEVVDQIIGRSQRSMAENISKIPDGRYEEEMVVDGFDHPLTIKCAVSISGQEIEIDYDGTSDQIDRPINSVMNYTYAYSCYAIKCALDPASPGNDGSFQSITVKAPEGSLLNPRRPAPVWGRHLSGHYLPPVIYGALSQVVPEKIIADCGSPLWSVYFKGRQTDSQRSFVKMFFMNGGHGARPFMDGPGCLSFPSNVSNQPIEQFENQVPILVTEKALIPDTGGAGKYRGGLAQRITFKSVGDHPLTVTIRHERVKFPPRGFLGGMDGSRGINLVNGEEIPPKFQTTLQQGDIATFQTPGGGGMGPVQERDPDRIRSDLKQGYITPEFAETHYGVVEESTASE